MSDDSDRTPSERRYNELIDMINAGRGLVPYVKHYPYCPFSGEGMMSRAVAITQLNTCNCGLADFVVKTFGVPVGAMTNERQIELSTLLFDHFIYHLENPDETLLKEVWEQCNGEKEIAFIGDGLAALAACLKDAKARVTEDGLTAALEVDTRTK